MVISKHTRRAPALLLALGLAFTACKTTQAPGLATREAAPPDVARQRAEQEPDAATAAEIAWIEANDRAYARKRLDEGLAKAPKDPALLLRRGLLSSLELDDEATLADFLEIIRSSPDTGEAEIALVAVMETLSDNLVRRKAITEAIDASGLLAKDAPAGRTNADDPDRASKVALASAIQSRIFGLDRSEDAMKAAVSRGGWLTAWRGLGPFAPRTLRSLATPTAAELQGIDAAGDVSLRGVAAPIRELDAWRIHVTPIAGDTPGLYVIESWVEIPESAKGMLLELEVHLRDSGRVLVDGTRVHEVVQGTAEAKGFARVQLQLAPGWHRISAAVLASSVTRPTFSLLGADGSPVIAKQSSRPPANAVKLPPTIAKRSVDLQSATSAAALVDRLLADPAHTLFGRLLGVQLASTHWRDELDRVRQLATEGAELAPRSAAMVVSESRAMARAGLPSSLSQARLREALALDESHPTALVNLARAILSDTPDQALTLVERLEKAAPRASEPHELRFRIGQQRGWNAEAAKSLDEALRRSTTESLLLDGASFYRGLMRFDDAKALEAKSLELAEPTPGSRAAGAALLAGDIEGAIRGYRQAARAVGSPAGYLARIANLELSRGNIDQAIAAAEEALKDDPLATNALRELAVALRAKGDTKKATAVAEKLRELGSSDLRVETFRAELLGESIGLPKKGSWLEKELAIDPRALATSAADDDLRWRRHKIVHLLDRIVDRVQADGHALSLRHAIVRLQTKEATDRAGEVNVPNDALPLALRTLKANGRIIDVDRHSGKDDLSFSALAPGDAVEKQWVSIDTPATAWGGYVRRFYFQSSAPSKRSELVVTAPKGAKVVWKGYNGAPEPIVKEEDGETIYLFRKTNVAAVEPEPSSVSQEEYLPFVVVTVNLDEQTALAANTSGVENLGIATWDVRRKAEALTKDAKSDAEKVQAIFRFLDEEIGHGGGREPSIVLATKRGDRTALFLAMLRAVGVDAQLALARTGAAPDVSPSYPSSTRFSQPLVRIALANGVVWASMDREHPWLGKATPDMRAGQYILPSTDAELPRPIAFNEAEVDRWPLASDVDLAVDANGNAKGTLSIELPGTYGAELREFLKSSRKDDVLRGLQGWVAAVLPGAKLEGYEAKNLDARLATLGLVANVTVPSFMVLESGHLISEQFFSFPIATQALGFPSLPAYLRVPNRSIPMWVTESGEHMHVRVTLPDDVRAPVEAPRSFKTESRFGTFVQTFTWDPSKHTATLAVEQALAPGRVAPSEFPKFRDLAQEVLQSSRNRLIVPVGAPPAPAQKTAARDRRDTVATSHR